MTRLAWARWVSIVLHPFVVMGLLTLVAVDRLQPGAMARVLPAFAAVIGIVLVVSLWRARSGAWNSVDASDSRDRWLLYALVIVLLVGYARWLRTHAPPLLPGVLAIIGLCVAGLLANRWIKLSLHMACLAYAAVAAWRLSLPLAVGFGIVLPLLAWSRLAMRRHTPREVAAGTALGALAGAVTLAFG